MFSGTSTQRDAVAGGGLLILSDSTDDFGIASTASPTFQNATFENLSADNAGAAFIGSFDGAEARPTFARLRFSKNTASGNGGAVQVYGSETDANNNPSVSNPSFRNAVFVGNVAESNGGGIQNSSTENGTANPTFTNTTFVGNAADTSGGAVANRRAASGSARPVFVNTIFWENMADANDDGAGRGGEIYVNSGAPSVRYSLIQGGCPSSVSCGSNLLETAPQFAGDNEGAGPDGIFGTADDDFRLQGPGSGGGASPAIDAGDNTGISASVDLAGNERKKDVDGVMNTGNTPNDNPPVDMGAYESAGNALPVELASLEAETTGDAVKLTWRTAAETNNAGFAVQRRAEDGTWTKVGFVDSKAEGGTTNQPQSYRFADKNASYQADSLTYRLRQVDTDGSTTLSDPVTVERRVSSLQVLGTAPNPARFQATLRYAVPERQQVTIRLYDVLGRRVRTVVDGRREGRHETRIDVRSLSSGVYFLRLTAGGTTRTQKVTVVQ